MKRNLVRLLLAALLIPHSGCAQESRSAEPLCIIQLSDPQFGFAAASRDCLAEIARMEQAVAIVNRLRPDAVIVTGDMVNSPKKRSELEEFTRIVRTIDPSIPVRFIPGNHDTPKLTSLDQMRDYLDTYGYDRFTFEQGGCLLIGINTNIIKDSVPQLEREQYEWLEEQLARASDARFKFVFSHCPPFARNIEERESYSNWSHEQRERYMRLLERYGVDALFAGHLHNHSEAQAYGVRVITTGSISKPLGDGFSGIRVIAIHADHYRADFRALDDFPAADQDPVR